MRADPSRHVCGAALSIVLAAASFVVARADTQVPPLPTLQLEAYPDAAREDIGGAYRRARTQPDDAAAVGAIGMILQAWQQFDQAQQAYSRAQALAPEELDWWYLGGLTADRRADHAEAVRQFARAHALAPDRPLIALRLADARLADGDLDGAASLYERLVGVPDTAPASWYGLGRIHLARREDAQARAAFERALSLYHDFGAAHYAMAQLHRRAGETVAANDALVRQRQCLACWPMPPDPWRVRVDALRSDAAALIARGVASASRGAEASDAEAIRLHEAALERDPARLQAHVNLVELYGRTGNVADAERHYRLALQAPAYAADAHRAWGLVQLARQQANEALPAFERALAVAPDDPAALQGTGLALEMLNRPDDAIKAYAQALRAAPTARAARFGLARASMRLGKIDEAIGHLERLREPVDAETARYLFALAVAHVRRGDVAEGRRLAEEALALARRFGDDATAATIEAELRKLRPTP